MAKEILVRQYKKTGYKNGFTKIGFVLPDLMAGQNSYLCISSSNKWLANNFGTNISIFFQEVATPCVHPSFARFHLGDVFTFRGNLIAISFDTLMPIMCLDNSRKFLYIQDLEQDRAWFKHNDVFDKVMKDSSVIKFCRSRDHRDKLKGLGYDILDDIVVDFDIEHILEIVNGSQEKDRN